jgi:hypothetical protein
VVERHQHLQAYLNEFTFRFNRRFYPFNAFRSLLGIAGGVTAPTYAELYSGPPAPQKDIEGILPRDQTRYPWSR